LLSLNLLLRPKHLVLTRLRPMPLSNVPEMRNVDGQVSVKVAVTPFLQVLWGFKVLLLLLESHS